MNAGSKSVRSPCRFMASSFILEVAVCHDNDGFIIGQLPDDTGHCGQLRQLRRQLAPVA